MAAAALTVPSGKEKPDSAGPVRFFLLRMMRSV